jgi:hypothetical protein
LFYGSFKSSTELFEAVGAWSGETRAFVVLDLFGMGARGVSMDLATSVNYFPEMGVAPHL